MKKEKQPEIEIYDVLKSPEGKNMIRRNFDELSGNFDDRVRSLGRVYGIEEEVEPYLLNNGPYRSHRDLDYVIGKSLENKKRNMLANLENIVDEEKPKKVSKMLALYGVVKDLGRYALYGALPIKIQEKIAEKHGENAITYSKVNMIAEPLLLGNISTIAFLAQYNNIGIATAILTGISIVASTFRIIDVTGGMPEPVGSFFIAVPYNTIRGIKNITQITGKSLKELYSKKIEQLEENQERIQLRIDEDLSQLPSPEPLPELVYAENALEESKK